MIGDILSSRSADTLSLLRQNQTSPAKADTDSLQLVDLHAVQEVDSGFEGTPEKIIRYSINPFIGLPDYLARRFAS